MSSIEIYNSTEGEGNKSRGNYQARSSSKKLDRLTFNKKLIYEQRRKGTFSKPIERKKEGGRENITLHNPSEQLRKKEKSSKYSRVNFREKDWIKRKFFIGTKFMTFMFQT